MNPDEPRKIYLATAGEYSGYHVVRAFTREEDARSYALADDVEEYELSDGPIEVRTRWTLTWRPHLPDQKNDGNRVSNPYESHSRRDFDGRAGHAQHQWTKSHRGEDTLLIGGWDLQRIRKVYSEQRAQYIATADLRKATP
jgi:hypothetical protein